MERCNWLYGWMLKEKMHGSKDARIGTVSTTPTACEAHAACNDTFLARQGDCDIAIGMVCILL